MRRVTLLALVCLAATAPMAEASWPRIDRAKAAAISYWHAAPPCGRVWTLKADTFPAREPGQRWAMFADPKRCVVLVNRAWYQRIFPPRQPRLERRYYWQVFCRSYVHEWGHLLGLGHSDDPASIMYPSPNDTPRVCLR